VPVDLVAAAKDTEGDTAPARAQRPIHNCGQPPCRASAPVV